MYKTIVATILTFVILTPVFSQEKKKEQPVEIEYFKKGKVVITPSFAIKGALRTNLIEEGAGKMDHTAKDATLEVGKYSIETIKLVPGK